MTGTTIGTLTGVGVGPGDPDLITVKGLRRLQSAAVVAYPMGLEGRFGIAEQIITPWLRSPQIRLPLHFPYVQTEEILHEAWDLAAQQVWAHVAAGRSVTFACEGDISFYSTFTYLAQTLKMHHPEVEIAAIPGVCSPLAAAASLGIPLTVRSQFLAILPALYAVSALTTALDWADVIVLMKVGSVYAEIWPILRDRGLLEQSIVIERATQPQQIIHDRLEQSPDLQLPYFSLMVIYTQGKPEKL